MMASADSVSLMKGSAFAPILSAAIPIVTEITMTCSTLKFAPAVIAPVSPSDAFTPRPRKFWGTRPIKKFHQVPTV